MLLIVADEQHTTTRKTKKFFKGVYKFSKTCIIRKVELRKGSIAEKNVLKNFLTSTSNDSMIVKSLDKRP
ncbi:hypothetical protein CPT06_16715 [Bacillus vallismortis]|nr:hypothetical protein CPT06_16715 [Bacillus vallismortis]